MKKLLFVLAFTFIGQQAFSQMYIVTINDLHSSHPSSCPVSSGSDAVMTTVDPQGNITYDCMPHYGGLMFNGNNIALLNQKFNYILGQGYKLVATDSDNDITQIEGNGSYDNYPRGAWYFAIP
tara:strand:- start:232 stop:600 length:369 start_codon:yes stop_codon:yes gene_type:complete